MSSVVESFLPLEIPTPDYASSGEVEAYKSVTHCDVLYRPDGWPNSKAGGTHSWKYWMAFTPYPNAVRENPCVVCSDDGITWQVPPGGSNPISPVSMVVADLGGSPGGTHHADTEIVILPDGRMALFYIGHVGSRTVLYRRLSEDGIVWGPRKITLDLTVSGGVGVMSPAIVVEDDGSLTMFHCRMENPDNTAHRIAWRTSTDNGESWGSETVCVYTQYAWDAGGNKVPEPWHIDVVKFDGVYHALVATTGGSGMYNRICYATSTNKTNWTFKPSTDKAILQTGAVFDGNSTTPHYRSSFVPMAGENGLRWDVWLCGIPTGHTEDGTFPSGNPWRIGLVRDIELPQTEIPSGVIVPPASCFLVASPSAMWAANCFFGARFTLDGPRRFRYICYRSGGVTDAAGYNEVGVYRMRGTNHLMGERVVTSTMFACAPINTSNRIDVGEFTLWPGNYLLYWWCSSATATFYDSLNDAVGASRCNICMARSPVEALGVGNHAMPEYMGLSTSDYSGWFLSGLSVEGDL